MVVKRLLLVVLGILLIVSLLGANVAVGLDRGPLDAGHVTDTLDDTDSYTELQGLTKNAIEDQVDEQTLDDIPGELDLGEIIDETLTEEYLRTEIDSNIESLYAFLHEETDQLELIVDVDALRDNLESALATHVAELSLAEFGIEAVEFPVLSQTVTANIGQLDQGQEAYEAELESFESDVKAVLQEETSQELTDDQLDAAYDDLRDELRSDVNDAVESAVLSLGLPEELESSAIDLGETIADAYTTDLTYADFDAQLTADKEAISTAAVSFAFGDAGLIPEELDLGEDIDRSALDPVKTVFSTIGMLALVLPLIVLGILAMMFIVTRDVVSVAKIAGVVSIIVGLVGLVATMIIPGLVDDLILSELEPGDVNEAVDLDVVTDLILEIFSGLLQPMFVQSIALVLLGGILIAGGYAYQRQRASSGSLVDSQDEAQDPDAIDEQPATGEEATGPDEE